MSFYLKFDMGTRIHHQLLKPPRNINWYHQKLLRNGRQTSRFALQGLPKFFVWYSRLTPLTNPKEKSSKTTHPSPSELDIQPFKNNNSKMWRSAILNENKINIFQSTDTGHISCCSTVR